jgi:uncharacterized protein (TIGR00369 family)
VTDAGRAAPPARDLHELIERIAQSPYHVWTGIKLVEAAPGRVVMRLDLQRHHLNPQGIVHGGVLAGLLDSVCGLSLRTILPDELNHRTIQLNINYLRAGVTGSITATGRAIHEGRRTGYSEGEVCDENGKLMARATGTFINLPRS